MQTGRHAQKQKQKHILLGGVINTHYSTIQVCIQLVAQAHAIDLYCNTDKTVAMVFPPKNRRLIIGNDFPLFRLGHEVIKYVSSFKYLGHVITQNCSDEEDIHREIRNLFNCTQTC